MISINAVLSDSATERYKQLWETKHGDLAKLHINSEYYLKYTANLIHNIIQ
jgi:hemoglobin-like flavoprotein